MELGLKILLHRLEQTDTNFICSLGAHDRMQENKPDDDSSIGDRAIPNDATVKELK